MNRAYQHIDVQRDGDVFCVSLRDRKLEDALVRAMSEEVESLIVDQNCRKLVFRLGQINCLFSVLIARLIRIKSVITERGGRLKLCEVSPQIMTIFESCQLQDFFEFAPDLSTAIAQLK